MHNLCKFCVFFKTNKNNKNESEKIMKFYTINKKRSQTNVNYEIYYQLNEKIFMTLNINHSFYLDSISIHQEISNEKLRDIFDKMLNIFDDSKNDIYQIETQTIKDIDKLLRDYIIKNESESLCIIQ